LLVLPRLRCNLNKEGMTFLGYLGLYSLGRFVLTFVREQNVFWGLQKA
jgi:prolipoprotein diacylglyceryltransferase